LVYWSEDDQCFLAEAPALKGCKTHGDSVEEAAKNGRQCVELWLDVAHEDGDFIPVPPARYSGTVTLRLPSSLHAKVSRQASIEGVSLNQWIASCLAEKHGGARAL